jgi:Fe-S-cluster-containing dehydrogenase component
MDRRRFLDKGLTLGVEAAVATGAFGAAVGAAAAATAMPPRAAPGQAPGYDPSGHYYGMSIEVDKCIGCTKCVEACKEENGVPLDVAHFRTWIERYVIADDGTATVRRVDAPGAPGADVPVPMDRAVRTFFVPKLCNQCDNPPCVQVCPVGATFKTEDGVILVDEERCIGCRYCIQACPYGARYINPATDTADKCTFCYHRITRGLLPACVEVCPTHARIFGDMRSAASPLAQFRRMHKLSVLKPALNTEPKVQYADLDGAVR